MKDLVKFIVTSLVEHPESISIEEKRNEKGKVLELRVAQTDLGRVIGKQGRTAKAIRTLLNAAATKDGGSKANLEIVE